VDQWISGGRCSHGGAETRRKQREETATRHKGNWRVPCSCLCVKHPWPVVAHRCFTLPRSSILCGCINIPDRQVNAVWGRYPTACAMYVKRSLECIGARRQNLSRLRVEKPGCASSPAGLVALGIFVHPSNRSGAGASVRLVATEATHSSCLCVAPPGSWVGSIGLRPITRLPLTTHH
jgi:hypothetical protein